MIVLCEREETLSYIVGGVTVLNDCESKRDRYPTQRNLDLQRQIDGGQLLNWPKQHLLLSDVHDGLSISMMICFPRICRGSFAIHPPSNQMLSKCWFVI